MASRAAYQKEWRERNPERNEGRKQRENRDPARHAEYMREYYSRNKEAIIAYREEPDTSRRRSDLRLRSTHGITREEYDAMHSAQNGVCALCSRPGRMRKHRDLVVDHDHETGRVRGLLCDACNLALGVLGDGSVGLERALEYIHGGS